jgi:hypothetical protein
MKNKISLISFLCIIILISGVINSSTQVKDTSEAYTDYSTQDTLNGVYIPKDIEDCFRQLDSFWSDSLKSELKKMSLNEFLSQAHFGIGMWLRNNWGLWVGSRLSKYFYSFNYSHPDDISSIILELYYRQLKGEDIHLEKWRK